MLQQKKITPWLLVSPAILTLALVMLYPLAQVMVMSVHRNVIYSQTHQFVGLKNYAVIGSYFLIPSLLINTIYWTFACLVFQFLFGFTAALILNRGFWGSNVLRTMLLFPWVISPIVTAIMWKWLYDPSYGIIDELLGQPIAWLGDPKLAMISLVIINVWQGFPFWMIMTAAGLKTIPAEIYDAATIDGANLRQQFFRMTIPSLRATLSVTILMAFIFTLNYFALMQVLTQGGPGTVTSTLPYAVYSLAFIQQNTGAASALSVMLAVVMVAIIGIYIRVYNKKDD